jgi:integrase
MSVITHGGRQSFTWRSWEAILGSAWHQRFGDSDRALFVSSTLFLHAGVNPKVVSERLGHSSVAFTLDSYTHVMPGMQPEAAAMFGELVFVGTTSDDREEDAR